MDSSTTLILGGARSGKSDFAELLARSSGRPVVFLATAAAGDPEMAARVERHRAARPATWLTIEEPLDLGRAVRTGCRPHDVLLIDCATLWVSNVMLSQAGEGTDPGLLGEEAWAATESALLVAVDGLLTLIRQLGLTAIVVSNEVGLGVVPPYPLGRRYRDALGRVNRAFAAHADRVLLLVAGLPIDLLALVPPELRPILTARGPGESE